jgi:signal transduction histidine kinase
MLQAVHPRTIPGASELMEGFALPVRRWPERRRVVLGAAALLFVGLFVLRMSTNDVNTGIGLLFVIPTGLVALELGMIAGLIAAGLSTALIIIWSTTGGGDLGVTGAITRAFVFFAVGAIGGRFSDRMRSWALRQRQLLDSGLELANLAGAGELPRIVAAQARTAVDAAGVRVTLADGGGAVDGAVHDNPVCVPIELRGEWLGEIEIEPGRPLVPEDEAALATIAVQAAVAIENVRLLIAGHERTDQLREVLSGQEDERRDVARHLHEESAQEMAGILLGLRAIERSLESEEARPQLDELREHAQSTLEGLRELAVKLRPPVLDLGLEEALRRLGERRSAKLMITLDGAAGRLSRDEETTVYRVVEEALDAFDNPGQAVVEASAGELTVRVGGARGEAPRTERVKTIGARLELIGGSLTTNGELRVRIPLS